MQAPSDGATATKVVDLMAALESAAWQRPTSEKGGACRPRAARDRQSRSTSTDGSSSSRTSTRSSTPRSGSPRRRSSTTTRGSRRCCVPHLARPAAHVEALPERRRRQVLLREELPVAHARNGWRRRRSPRRPRTTIDRILPASTTPPRSCGSANLAALELHAADWRAADVEQPDARRVRPRPRAAGRRRRVRGGRAAGCATCSTGSDSRRWPKTSARRACRSTCRCNTPRTYDDTKPFAHAIAQLLEKRHTELVVVAHGQGAPQGQGVHRLEPERIAQDDDRRRTRCGPGQRPTVSTPVTWDEVENAEHADDLAFEATTSSSASTRHGDLFEPVLTTKQKLPKHG